MSRHTWATGSIVPIASRHLTHIKEHRGNTERWMVTFMITLPVSHSIESATSKCFSVNIVNDSFSKVQAKQTDVKLNVVW